jgi:hypothetical protein
MKAFIINVLLLLILSATTRAQLVINPSFSEHSPNGDLNGWKLSGQYFSNDSNNAHTPSSCIYTYNMENGLAKCVQVIPFHPGKHKYYKLKVFIRTETREGFASAWIKLVDKNGSFIFRDGIADNMITGKTRWREYEVLFHTTADVDSMEIGMSLTGKGKAWFDDVSIEALPDSIRPVNKIAEKYLGEIYGILNEQCIYRDSVNLKEAYLHSLELAANAISTGDCYEGVAYMMDRLGDGRGEFLDPATSRNWLKEQKINDEEPIYPTAKLDSGLVTIMLPGVTASNKNILHKYADTLHQQLKAIDQTLIKGWILDLRENVGGKVTPMLAAIGPLLNQEISGKYITTKGDINWVYKKGKAQIDTNIIRVRKPFNVKNPELPIAVLTSRQTFGAAEMVVVAFRNRANVRYFGEPTAGITIRENRITLSDKATLTFTSGIMCDSKGKRFTGRIIPDTKIRLIYTEDHCLRKAVEWLKGKS